MAGRAPPCIRALRSIAADAMPRLVEWLLDSETPARVRSTDLLLSAWQE
jgi:hypothetical protein